MLIKEGRTPDSKSKRGYKEGEHVNTKSEHICSSENDSCHIAYQIKTKIKKCIDDNYNLLNVQNSNINTVQSIAPSTTVVANVNNLNCSNNSSSSVSTTTTTTTQTIITSNNIKRSKSPIIQQSSIITNNLTHNIHIIIDVLLVANCCYDIIKGELVENKSIVSYELLERWNFNIMQNKRSENTKHTFNELYQAIRSYLHFSQISSWLNQSNGDSPKTLAYSVFYYNESNINPIIPPTNNDDLNTYLNEYLINDKEFILTKLNALRRSSTSTSTSTSSLSINQENNNNDTIIDTNNNFTDSKANLITLANFYNQITGYDDSYLFDYDSQNFPPINLLCNNNNALFINLKSKKRLSLPIIPSMTTSSSFKYNIPHIVCTNLNKCCKYKILNKNNDETNTDENSTKMLDHMNHERKKSLKCQKISSICKRRNTTDISNQMKSFIANELRTQQQKRQNELDIINESSLTASYNDTTDMNLLSPIPGERRRLSLDTFDFDLNKRQTKLFKSINEDTNESHQLQSTPNINIKRSFHLNLPQPSSPPSSQTKSKIDQKNLSYSPSSPIIVLSSLSSQLSELCTYTQNQLSLNEELDVNSTSKDTDSDSDNNNKYRPHFYIESPSALLENSSLDDDDDNLINGDESCQNDSSNDENHKIVHYIRSPTDGVCVPIYKTDSIYFDSNDNTSLTHLNDFPKRSLRCNPKFQNRSGLPLSSSPAPMRKSGSAFNFDQSIRNPKSIKNALSLSVLAKKNVDDDDDQQNKPYYFNSRNFNLNLSNRLLGNFEESLLNGRMHPVGIVDGFYAEIGASGSFFPEHITLPVHAAFYHVCEDVAASPYLGIINLSSVGRRGYKVPNKGTIQVTLFNPNNTVVKMFVVMYDMSDMQPNHRTFLRQRTMYVPLPSLNNSDGDENEEMNNLKSYLRYSIHLRFVTSKSGKLYLHTNIKLIFARNKCEIDPRLAKYEYKTFTEAPKNPRYSAKK